MTKPTITKIFVGSLIAIAGGFLLMVGAGLTAYLNGALIMDGPDVVGVQSSGLGLTMLGLAVVGCVVMAGGGIAQFVAWIGAVLNTSKLEDKTWFLLLLVLGLLSFGFIPMVIYVLTGPDGTSPETRAAIRYATTPRTA
jgi:hypothetical protein